MALVKRWAVLLAVLAISCAKKDPPPNDSGSIGRDYDPYTATPQLRVHFVIAPRQPLSISRNAREVVHRVTMTFVRDPSLGDIINLQVRHECSYELDGKRVECLPTPCSAKGQAVTAQGLLDGAPATLPRVDCKGYGRAAVDYSAALSRQATRQIAQGRQFWLRVPTGEFGLDQTHLARLRDFMKEVERTPDRYGPQGVDLTR